MKWFYWVLFLATLIPLSVDNRLNIPISNYDIRIPYLTTVAIFCITLLSQNIRQEYFRFLTALPRVQITAFFAFLMVGAVGALNSVHPTRSLMYLAWTIGTLGFVPWLVCFLRNRIGSKIFDDLLIGYVFFQTLIILIDALICIPTEGKWHIGRVMMYLDSYNGNLCRPHAFYQEPGYFVVFAAPVAFLLLLKGRYLLSALITIGICATTSRLGWYIGVVYSLMFCFFIFKNKIRFATKTKVGFAILLFAVGAVATYKAKTIYFHTFKGFIAPQTDGSISHRRQRLNAAMAVFYDSPWVGAGPGASGAKILQLDPDAKTKYGLYPNQKDDALSMNLYTELLSEWGGLGFVFFFIFWAWFFLPISSGLWPVGLALILGYTSNGTLARFDLWFILSWILTQKNESR